MSELPPFIRTERLTPEQRALLHKRDGMILSRKRVLHDLETSRSPTYRRSLEAGLEFLDRQIAEVDRALLALVERGNTAPAGGAAEPRVAVKPRARRR